MNKAYAGQLLLVDRGSYSDYEALGFFVVLKDFEPLAELETYLQQNPDEKESCAFKEERYLSQLISKGFLLEIEYGNLFLSKYSESKDVYFRT